MHAPPASGSCCPPVSANSWPEQDCRSAVSRPRAPRHSKMQALDASSGPQRQGRHATQTRIAAPSAGSLTSFSSYGPAVDLSFKPELAAPGSLIVRLPTHHPPHPWLKPRLMLLALRRIMTRRGRACAAYPVAMLDRSPAECRPRCRAGLLCLQLRRGAEEPSSGASAVECYQARSDPCTCCGWSCECSVRMQNSCSD